MFTHAPSDLVISRVANAWTASCDWEVRASRVSGQGPLIKFAELPEFPQRINRAWLIANVPGMDEGTFERFLTRLRQKRWTEVEIADRVLPLRVQRPVA